MSEMDCSFCTTDWLGACNEEDAWSGGCLTCLEKFPRHKHQMLVEDCLEVLSLHADCHIVCHLRSSFPEDLRNFRPFSHNNMIEGTR